MKKKSQKLQLSRETLHRLVPEDLDKIQGAIVSSDNFECTFGRKRPSFTSESY